MLSRAAKASAREAIEGALPQGQLQPQQQQQQQQKQQQQQHGQAGRVVRYDSAETHLSSRARGALGKKPARKWVKVWTEGNTAEGTGKSGSRRVAGAADGPDTPCDARVFRWVRAQAAPGESSHIEFLTQSAVAVPSDSAAFSPAKKRKRSAPGARGDGGDIDNSEEGEDSADVNSAGKELSAPGISAVFSRTHAPRHVDALLSELEQKPPSKRKRSDDSETEVDTDSASNS